MNVRPIHRRSVAPRGLHASFTVRSDRDRRKLIGRLDRGLAELSRRTALPAVQALVIQLLVQVCGPEGYVTWREAREKAWRRQGGLWSAAAWPERLEDAGSGALLLPLAAGRVGLAVGEQPRAVADPVFMAGTAPRNCSFEDLALGLVTTWATNRSDAVTAVLAPPVLEVVSRRGVLERRVLGWGLEWPLPAPHGV